MSGEHWTVPLCVCVCECVNVFSRSWEPQLPPGLSWILHHSTYSISSSVSFSLKQTQLIMFCNKTFFYILGFNNTVCLRYFISIDLINCKIDPIVLFWFDFFNKNATLCWSLIDFSALTRPSRHHLGFTAATAPVFLPRIFIHSGWPEGCGASHLFSRFSPRPRRADLVRPNAAMPPRAPFTPERYPARQSAETQYAQHWLSAWISLQTWAGEGLSDFARVCHFCWCFGHELWRHT